MLIARFKYKPTPRASGRTLWHEWRALCGNHMCRGQLGEAQRETVADEEDVRPGVRRGDGRCHGGGMPGGGRRGQAHRQERTQRHRQQEHHEREAGARPAAHGAPPQLTRTHTDTPGVGVGGSIAARR
jgi:hypothetical protein